MTAATVPNSSTPPFTYLYHPKRSTLMPSREVYMKKLGKNYEFHIYEHATHGFAEYQQLGGNPAAIKDAWARAIAFLKKNTM